MKNQNHIIKKTAYLEMFPDEFLKEISVNPIGYLPIGAAEWHSYHLPLGFDGLACQIFFEKLALKKGGVVFPSMHYGVAENMPHPASFVINDSSFKNYLKSVLKGIRSLDIKVMIVSTGHLSINQMKYVLETAQEFNNENKDFLVCGIPLGLVLQDEGFAIDHAGVYETSLGMVLMPEKVKIERLGNKYLGQWDFPDEMQVAEFGIESKKDPRQYANKEYGMRILDAMLKKYSEIINQMLEGKMGLIESYHAKTLEFINSNFQDLYDGKDPVRFYKKVRKIVKAKNYISSC